MVEPLFEVELKFRVTNPDDLRRRFDELGTTWSEPVQQCDRYFAHPARDFRQTDEALRIRTVGDRHWITYKGPVIDTLTKTRHEIEAPLGDGSASLAQMIAVLVALGFRPVREVPKTRRDGQLAWQGRPIACTWDDVPPVGTFVELEIVTNDAGRAAARGGLLSLADHLNLTESERRSYLQLLLEQDLA
jgi:adenylate cyclase class 2